MLICKGLPSSTSINPLTQKKQQVIAIGASVSHEQPRGRVSNRQQRRSGANKVYFTDPLSSGKGNPVTINNNTIKRRIKLKCVNPTKSTSLAFFFCMV